MASNFGFVYVLHNDCMPGIYKIGMTDRSPRQRCEELSSSTSTPVPFEMACVGEVQDAYGFEKLLHGLWAQERVSDSREFFRLSPRAAVELAETIEDRVRRDGGMFCFLMEESLRDQARHEEAEAERWLERQKIEGAIAHFVGQSADVLHWPNPDGFGGYGDIHKYVFDDSTPF